MTVRNIFNEQYSENDNVTEKIYVLLKFLKAIETTYKNKKAKVITPDGDTSHFDIKAGVLQGDTLAPYLFVIILDYIMRQTYKDREDELGFTLQKRKSKRVPSVFVCTI